MLNYVETTSISTIVSPSSVSSVSERETKPLPSLSVDPNEYVWLRIGKKALYGVSPLLKQGYLAACQAYTEMEEHDPCGPYIFLTGYEYAHLARRFMPVTFSPVDKREWHRGFILGWNVCTLGLQEDAEPTTRASRSVNVASRSAGTDGWPLDR
jgi:hypothetical protein